MNTQATSISLLQEYMLGTVIDLPEFGPDQPFSARLRRPSITNLIRSGRIPNELMSTAAKLFNEQPQLAMAEQDGIKQVLGLFDIFVEAALVEPTYAEIKAANIELTDEQKMAIYNYCQGGARALAPFRREQESSGSAEHVADLQGAALGAPGPS